MEYETAAQLIELLAMVVMAAAFYYGCSLIKFIPKEQDHCNWWFLHSSS